MKKKLMMVLVVTAMTLVGCKGNSADAETGNTSSNDAANVETEDTGAADNAEDTDAADNAEDTDAADNAEAEGTETEGDADTDESYGKGVITESSYESDWMGIKFTAPEGYIMATEEELSDLMGMSMEMVDEDFNELQKKYAELTTVYEMMCVSPTSMSNVNVMSEKLMLSSMSVDQYIEALKSNLTGAEIDDATETVTIGGKEFTKLHGVVTDSGTTAIQDYYIAKQDKRMCVIIVTYLEGAEAEADAILAGFTSL